MVSLARVFEQALCPVVILVRHHHTAQNCARAAFKHAHMPVEDEYLDFFGFQQGIGPGQKDDFVASEKFSHVRSTLTVIVSGLCSDCATQSSRIEEQLSVVIDLDRERQERPTPSLDALTALTQDDIQKVNQAIIARMDSPVILIPQVAGHIIAAGGKRLRPVELGPFEYEHENYTTSLWIVEGITSYYQHVILTRAGFYTRDSYLGAVSGSIAGTQRTPGRLVQAFSDSSFDAWIKAYRSDENSVNTLFSYYGGGAVAGFLIDAKIQESSNGAKSLDDVMRAAYERYSGLSGYTQEQFIALASEVSGHDLTVWFDELVNQPGEFDYQPALDWYGLEFEQPKPPAKPEAGTPAANAPPDPPKGWLGAGTADQNGRLTITQVRSDTPAAAARLSVDDEIIAVEGLRVSNSQLDRRLELYGAETTVEFLISRRDQITTVPVTLGLKPEATWRLKVRSDATEAQKARVTKWLTSQP